MDLNNNKCHIEILCIGTELLLGNILNSNARWLSEELAVLGLAHYHQSVVGDNSDRIQTALIQASKRSNVLIITGGIGPTPDDITHKSIADAFNTELKENEEIWLEIQKRMSYKSTLLKSKSNRKQALLPEGARHITNPSGTAPGIIWSPAKNFTIITLPGVPSELKLMWHQSVVPWFYENNYSCETLISKVLKIVGIPESTLAEQFEHLMSKKNPTIAPYAGLGEVKIRISAKGTDRKKAEELIQPIEQEIRMKIGSSCYGTNQDTLASVVIEMLLKKGETLGVAESCTGGALSASITSISGSSNVFKGGIIAYSNEIKTNLLGIPEELLQKNGAVSKPVVEEMAKGARKYLKTDWSIAISGLAGPGGGTKEKPVGLVHFCICGPNDLKTSFKVFDQNKGRIAIQNLSVVCSLDQIRLILLSRS